MQTSKVLSKFNYYIIEQKNDCYKLCNTAELINIVKENTILKVTLLTSPINLNKLKREILWMYLKCNKKKIHDNPFKISHVNYITLPSQKIYNNPMSEHYILKKKKYIRSILMKCKIREDIRILNTYI